MIVYYSAPVGVQSIVINPSVCLCVIFPKFGVQIPCCRGSVRLSLNISRTCRDSKEQYEPIVWLGPPMSVLRYVVYFRFYG